VKLHTVHKEKPTEELVGRERETAQEEGKEHHLVAALGLGDALGAGEDNLVAVDDESISLGLGEIRLLELRRHPIGRCIGGFAFPHLVLVRKGLYAHLRWRQLGGYAGAQKRARFAAMMAAAEI
jgi:hypothetical protein